MEDAKPAVLPADSELASAALTRKFELDIQISLIQGKHKAELEPLTEELGVCMLFVKDFMNTAGLQQYKLANGDQAFFQAVDRVSAPEFEATLDYIVAAPPMPGFETMWPQILQHIRAEGNWNLLNRAVNKTAVQEYVKAHSVPPPGVKFDSFKDLQWRKGKAKA